MLSLLRLGEEMFKLHIVNSMLLVSFFCIAVVPAVCAVGEKTKSLPLYPMPKRVTQLDKFCNLDGTQLFIPSNANEKSVDVAQALASRLSVLLNLPNIPQIRREGTVPRGVYVLMIGRNSPNWQTAIRECSFEQIHPTLREQAYFLKITPENIIIFSSGSWGLSYGAVTLMQLARCAGKGTSIPCVIIYDWPDLELRAVLSSYIYTPVDYHRTAAAFCWEGKLNMIVSAFPIQSELHPELSLKIRRDPLFLHEYLKVIRQIRAAGLELIAGADFSRGHFWEYKSNPYLFMQDNATYFWAMKDIIDEWLEVFRSRYFHLGMDEEHLSLRHGKYPHRTIEQWRDVATEFTKHLRRRGVTAIAYSDELMLLARGDYFSLPSRFGKLPEGFNKFVETFPDDLILQPWFYWVKSVNDVLKGKGDMLRQAKTGKPVIFTADGGNIQYHVDAARTVKPEFPNVLGVMSCCFGPNPFIKNTKDPRYPRYVFWAIGQLWNMDAGKKTPEGFVEERNLYVSNWECLLDADPPESIENALLRLRAKDWRIWLTAREELVSAGLPAAPELLDAMSKAEGEFRERIEGCLSRNARDARNGRKRGTLDVEKVMRFLNDANETVRDISAELLASASEAGIKNIRFRVKDPRCSSSCIRALALVKDKSCVEDFVAVLNDINMPVRAKIEAVKAIGKLQCGDFGSLLQKVLHNEHDKELRLAALWSLVLTKAPEASKECVAFLDSKDEDFRYRSAMGLLALRSPDLERLIPWLSKDRDSMEIAAMSLYIGWDRKRLVPALCEAKMSQKDKIACERLDEWLNHITQTNK